jgi:predicted Zn-ribbon and HTH transcriptional regulator
MIECCGGPDQVADWVKNVSSFKDGRYIGWDEIVACYEPVHPEDQGPRPPKTVRAQMLALSSADVQAVHQSLTDQMTRAKTQYIPGGTHVPSLTRAPEMMVLDELAAVTMEQWSMLTRYESGSLESSLFVCKRCEDSWRDESDKRSRCPECGSWDTEELI